MQETVVDINSLIIEFFAEWGANLAHFRFATHF